MVSDSEKSKEELIEEIKTLRNELALLRKSRALTREDRLKLSILDRSPFTIWACDKDFNIQLWAGACGRNYGYSADEAIGKNYLELFVDDHEKDQSCGDCIAIIEKDKVFSNFLASDIAEDGSTRLMLTNCFRIYDEDTQQWLQAEIGLEISDLEDSEKEHRNIREKGAYDRGMRKKLIDLQKDILSRKVVDVSADYQRIMFEKQRDLEARRRRLEPELGEVEAKKMFTGELEQLEKERKQLANEHQELLHRIFQAEKETEIEILEEKVAIFEKRRK